MATLNWARRCSSRRLAVAIRASRAVSGGPHAFRKPVGRRLVPGAFHAPVLCRILATSSCVISWFRGKRWYWWSSKSRQMLLRSAVESGKNLCASTAAFSKWLVASLVVSGY